MERAHESVEPLYAHTKRPSWGLAILAFEGRERRRYQFQDGVLRTFKRGYYELMEPVDEPYDTARDIVRDLKSRLRIERARLSPEPTPKSVGRIISFDDQIRIFAAFYPEGFQDAGWTAEVRGGEGKRLKRHRLPAVADAHRLLAKEELAKLIQKKDFETVRDQLMSVLACTDLTSSKDTAPLRHLPAEHLPDLARVVADLLHGDAPYDERFAAWLEVLGRTPDERVSWPLATAPSALVHPAEHVAIKPSIFRDQAQWMAPSMPYDAHPSPGAYERFLKMATEVSNRLEREGLSPVDLLDVYDFVWTTLRPKGRKKLEELSGSASEEGEEGASAEAPTKGAKSAEAKSTEATAES